MSNEASVRSGLNIRIGTNPVRLDYRSAPSGFTADVSTANGPSPGAVTVTRFGTTVSLAQLASPGFCFLANLDATYWVEYGAYDPTNPSSFVPIGEIGPGESYVIRLSRFLGKLLGTGSGTVSHGGTAALMFKVIAAPVGTTVKVRVDAFDR